MNRAKQQIIKHLLFTVVFTVIHIQSTSVFAESKRPNILFCISDDQSYDSTGANGDPVVKTPAFDRIAHEGIRFTNPYCSAPTCGPSRSSILTGQPIWRLEQAANIHSTLPKKFALYTELLAESGYNVGSTGKGWSPGPLRAVGRTINPAGKKYLGKTIEGLPHQIVSTDYAGNFEDFLAGHDKDKPFCFWLGTCEPHRGYAKGSGLASGMDPSKVIVPPFLPDNDEVRDDFLDYYYEVQYYDKMVERAIKSLEDRGLLDNTIVVVTSDHGMPFPRAKASLYDAGSKVPLAIRWPKGIKNPGRVYDGFVNLGDIAPTFLEAAGVDIPEMMIGKSLIPVFKDEETSGERPHTFFAMERHDGCRAGGKGYPMRAIRTGDYLYIVNFEPDRWPAGDPDEENCARWIPFGEVDPAPTKYVLMNNKEQYRRFYDLAFAKRPAVELYNLANDPAQLHNVAEEPKYANIKSNLDKQLRDHLIETKDPRLTGGPVLWDYYPYYGRVQTTKGKGKTKVLRTSKWSVDPAPAELAKYLPPDPLQTFAPGWKLQGGGHLMEAGFHDQKYGRQNIYITHPRAKGKPCILFNDITPPIGKKSTLSLTVGHHPKGDWDLVVRADGKELLKKVIGANTTNNGWADVSVDLSEYSGQTVTLELVNQPNGWIYEGALWGKIAIQ